MHGYLREEGSVVKGEVRLSEDMMKKVPSSVYLRIISEEGVAMLRYVFREIICV